MDILTTVLFLPPVVGSTCRAPKYESHQSTASMRCFAAGSSTRTGSWSTLERPLSLEASQDL